MSPSGSKILSFCFHISSYVEFTYNILWYRAILRIWGRKLHANDGRAKREKGLGFSMAASQLSSLVTWGKKKESKISQFSTCTQISVTVFCNTMVICNKTYNRTRLDLSYTLRAWVLYQLPKYLGRHLLLKMYMNANKYMKDERNVS